MHHSFLANRRAALAAPFALTFGLSLALTPVRGFGDEPGILGRLFRGGNTAASAKPVTNVVPKVNTDVLDPATAANFRTTPPPLLSPGDAPPPTPTVPVSPGSRLVPQPRTSRPATEAESVLTRVSLGRSDDGTQFGMFLQVYADGTVIDGEGTHRPGREAVKPVLDAVAQGDLFKVKGHCGGASTDFIEQVYMVVYDRRMRANAFSFSGNTQGCDQAVRHLQTVLDTLQTKISRPMTAARPVMTEPSSLAPAAAPIPLSDSVASPSDAGNP